MRFARQLGVVLETYLTRPAFIIIVLAGIAGVGFTFAIGRWGYHVEFSIGVFLLTSLLYTLPVTMSLAFIVMFFIHVRQQLRGPLAALTPEFRAAHLIVGAMIFFGIVFGLSSIYYYANVGRTPWNFYVLSYFGVFLVAWTFMTLGALAAIESPWWLVELVPIMIAAVASSRVQYLLQVFVQDFGGYFGPNFHRQPAQFQAAVLLERITEMHDVWLARIVVMGLNILCLAFLGWRARPPKSTPWTFRTMDQIMARFTPRRTAVEVMHRPVATVLKRGWHRRFAVHDQWMAWGVAGGIAAICTLITLLVGHDPRHLTVAAQSLIMLSVIPGTVVAASWYGRLPSLGYESLLPCRRDQFANEMAIAMAIDLGEFWLAGCLGALVPLLIWEPRTVVSPAFLISVAASGLMQVLLFGGALLSARWRAGVIFGVLMLILLFLAIFVPMMETWTDHPSLKPAGLLVVALVEMGAGLVMAIIGYSQWMRGEFA